MSQNALTPRKANFSLGGLRQARQQIGTGGGDGRFLKINHKTGEMTIGNSTPFDKDLRYAIRIEDLRYGYYIFEGKKSPNKENMVPMISGKPKPIPSTPYAKYPEDGPVDITEIQLHPITKDNKIAGSPIEFGPTSVSSQNRIANLVEAIDVQSQLPAGQVGFTNPILMVFPGMWTGDYGDIYHFDYKVVDWADASGELTQSVWEATNQIADQTGNTEDALIDPETGEVLDEDYDPLG